LLTCCACTLTEYGVAIRWLCVQGCRRNCTRFSRHIRGGSANRTVSSRRFSPKWRRRLRSSPSRRSRSSAISPSVIRCVRRPLPVCSGPCVWWSSCGWPRVSRPFRIPYTHAPITTCSIRWPGVRSSTHLSAPYPASGCQIWDTRFRYYDASLKLSWRGTFHTWYGSNDLDLWSFDLQLVHKFWALIIISVLGILELFIPELDAGMEQTNRQMTDELYCLMMQALREEAA